MSGRRDPSVVLSEKICQGLDSMSVDPERVASFASMAGPAIKVRLFKFVMQLLHVWALEFDSGELGPDDDSMRIQVWSKRLIDLAKKDNMFL